MDEETMQAEGEAPETEVTPEQHKLYMKMKQYNPEGEYADDTSVMDAAHDKLSEYDTQSEETEKLLENIANAVEQDPEYAAITNLVAKGMPFRQAVSRYLGPEDLTAEEGDPDYEGMETNRQQRLADKAAREALIAEVQSNTKESEAVLQKFAEDNNLDEEAMTKYVEMVDGILKDAYKGKFSYDLLARLLVSENHEKEVADAAEQGMIEGKNAAIDEKLSLEETNKAGDGLPSITSSVSVTPEPVKRTPTEMELIAERSKKSRTF